jgi:hypothetical protein
MGVSVSKVEAKIGSAEFLDPDIRISPLIGPPPLMINLSIEFYILEMIV